MDFLGTQEPCSVLRISSFWLSDLLYEYIDIDTDNWDCLFISEDMANETMKEIF